MGSFCSSDLFRRGQARAAGSQHPAGRLLKCSVGIQNLRRKAWSCQRPKRPKSLTRWRRTATPCCFVSGKSGHDAVSKPKPCRRVQEPQRGGRLSLSLSLSLSLRLEELTPVLEQLDKASIAERSRLCFAESWLGLLLEARGIISAATVEMLQALATSTVVAITRG